MSERRPIYKKGSLLYATIVALACVMTASVSTFAWFQAEANVRISTTNSSTSISVAAPDPIGVSNPQVFMYRGNPTGTSVTGTPYDVVGTAALRKVGGLYPGEQITFVIKVAASGSATITSGSMNLTYQAFHLLNREIYGDSTKVVTILSAIQVSAGISTDGAYPTSMVNKLSPQARGGILKSSLTAVVNDDENDGKYKLNTAGSISNAVNNASIGANTAYFFFTVLFLNTPDTFYIEEDSAGNTDISTPTDAGTRFFTAGNTGSSTCYENLNFNITGAAITVI